MQPAHPCGLVGTTASVGVRYAMSGDVVLIGERGLRLMQLDPAREGGFSRSVHYAPPALLRLPSCAATSGLHMAPRRFRLRLDGIVGSGGADGLSPLAT